MMNDNQIETKVEAQVKAELKKYEEMKKDAQAVETIGDLLNYSIKIKDRSTAVLLEFLWREKQSVSLSDKLDVLNVYLLEKHRDRLNAMIMQFIDSGKSIYNDLI
jgi:hypothetical protein